MSNRDNVQAVIDGILKGDILGTFDLQDSPNGRPNEHRPSSRAQVIGLPRVGGLQHRYEWQRAG
jgi:hypothetical protein